MGGEIIEWNESNCAFDECQYVKAAIDRKGWAYLSDYYRLKALYEFGGIYLDTDIEVKKELDAKFYDADLVLGYMYDCYISTAFIMAKPKHPFIKKLLDAYDKMEFNPNYANNALMTFTFLDEFPDFKLVGRYCEFADNCFIYPKEYFEAPILRGDGGYCVHHFTGFWKPQGKLKRLIRPLIKYILFYCHVLNVAYNFHGRRAALKSNPCLERYLNDSSEFGFLK